MKRKPIDWRRYEAEKQALPRNLTPAQYEAAVQALAKRLGI
jgi:hypothetical protein